MSHYVCARLVHETNKCAQPVHRVSLWYECPDLACIVPRKGARPPRRSTGDCPVAGASDALHAGPPCARPAGHPRTPSTCTLLSPTSSPASSPRVSKPDPRRLPDQPSETCNFERPSSYGQEVHKTYRHNKRYARKEPNL